MGASETAKEIVRIASTAGLSKDVIDLLEKKLVLLTEENRILAAKVSRLEIENGQLRRQLQDSSPVGFVENMGVLWKRTANGFEAIPYCKECPSHPIMTPIHDGGFLLCGPGTHQAPLSVRPPPG